MITGSGTCRKARIQRPSSLPKSLHCLAVACTSFGAHDLYGIIFPDLWYAMTTWSFVEFLTYAIVYWNHDAISCYDNLRSDNIWTLLLFVVSFDMKITYHTSISTQFDFVCEFLNVLNVLATTDKVILNASFSSKWNPKKGWCIRHYDT